MEKAALILGVLAVLLSGFSYYFSEINARDVEYCRSHGGYDSLVLLTNMTDENELRRGAVKSNDWQCYFGNSYFEMRSGFREAADSLGLEVYAYPLPNFPELTTDAVVLEGGTNNNNVVFHISGTHGPEGFVGSATQRAFLRQVALCRANSTCAAEAQTSWPTVVLVHGLNAYGFANNRRFTEESVDLNRNFLSEAEFAELVKRDHNLAGYMDFDWLINPTAPLLLAVPDYPSAAEGVDPNRLQLAHALAVFYTNEAWGFLRAGVAVALHGVGAIKRALVTGNYYKSSGVYYGGRESTYSARILLRIADELVNSRSLRPGVDPAEQRAVIIDVHSGLGPSGVDTLAVDDAEELGNLETIFPTEFHEPSTAKGPVMTARKRSAKALARPKAGLKSASMGNAEASGQADKENALSGYDLMVGGVTQGFTPHLLPHLEKNHNKHAVTQEFGTVNMIVTGQRVATENYAHHHGNDFEKRIAGENLRSCFYVDTKKWKYDVARRGVIVLTQALQYLSVPHQQ